MLCGTSLPHSTQLTNHPLLLLVLMIVIEGDSTERKTDEKGMQKNAHVRRAELFVFNPRSSPLQIRPHIRDVERAGDVTLHFKTRTLVTLFALYLKTLRCAYTGW